jgi:toluene monooxygenase system protein E
VTRPRTYWHLRDLGRKPNDYDIATTKLLYYPGRGGLEVKTPAGAWMLARQAACPLKIDDWDRFRDPRETTYARYVAMQHEREIFVDGLLRSVDDTGYDARLSARWLATLARVIGPLRYPVHGLQMAAAYVGQGAPGGRIVVACAMQAGDEMRRIQRLAYRMRQLQVTYPDFGRDAKAIWQDDPQWQPLRRAIERLLVTYEWGEAFAALNLAIKPAFDDAFGERLALAADREGDDVLAKILRSLADDTAWHRAWSAALVEACIAHDAANAAIFGDWIAAWKPTADAAVAPFSWSAT